MVVIARGAWGQVFGTWGNCCKVRFEPIVTPPNVCDTGTMKRISIDISSCKTVDDFYCILLSALEAPDWHGRNLDALWDSVTSDINNVMPPYAIELSTDIRLPPSVAALVPRVKALFEEAREQEHIEVEFKVS
jgi:RNAse (barnase) inhibitor barstar